MKKLMYLIVLALILGMVLTGCFLSNVGQVPSNQQSGISGMLKNGVGSSITKNYGDIDLTSSGVTDSEHFMEVWDLTACDMVISFTYNANGLVDDETSQWQDHAWAALGVHSPCYVDFNPTWEAEGAGVWLATDYEEFQDLNTFEPDPEGSPTQDLDDKLILQKGGNWGEGSYNLPSTPSAPGNNHRVWFDRDGVDEWQDNSPLAVDGGTYNTQGTYEIVITLHATDNANGTAYMTINGLNQGFETNGDWNTMELTPAGMTFTGDMTKMQVFYGLYGYGATHSVAFEDINVDGCLSALIEIGDITIDPELIAVDTPTDLEAPFTGPTGGDATINWGDGNTDDPADVSDIAGKITGSHEYTNAGVYTVEVTLAIECTDLSDTAEFQYVVVYDPSAGFVTGGGWIDSPAGAYVEDETLSGKASFGFVSKYKKGATVPTGNTEFQFKAGDLNFHSYEYDWLVIAGAKAKYKGTGTINGTGEYGFMLSAVDEELTPSTDVDLFRIKIWDKDNDIVIYDNQTGDGDDADPTTAIGGGQIVIHK